MVDLDDMVRASYELEPLSPTVIKLAGLVSDPQVGLDEIVEVVSCDLALVAHMIRMANSPSYRGTTDVETVADAAARLGSGRILSLATWASARRSIGNRFEEFGLSEESFWNESRLGSLVADLARNRHCREIVPPVASTAALLRDIGKLIVAQFLSPRLKRTLAEAQADLQGDECAAEREVLGADHAEIGGLIAQHWQLPNNIRLGVHYHHDPDASEDSVSDVVHLAHAVATEILSSDSSPGSGDGLTSSVLGRLSMSQRDYAELVDGMAEHLESLADA